MHVFDMQGFPVGWSICEVSGMVTSVTQYCFCSLNCWFTPTDKHQTDKTYFSWDDLPQIIQSWGRNNREIFKCPTQDKPPKLGKQVLNSRRKYVKFALKDYEQTLFCL